MSYQLSTNAVHAGETGRKPFGSVTTPIVQSSTFTFKDSADILDFMKTKASGERPAQFEYGRYGNPTQRAAEEKLAALESGLLSQERYESFQKLVKESAYYERSYFERRQRDKKFGRMVKSVLKKGKKR